MSEHLDRSDRRATQTEGDAAAAQPAVADDAAGVPVLGYAGPVDATSSGSTHRVVGDFFLGLMAPIFAAAVLTGCGSIGGWQSSEKIVVVGVVIQLGSPIVLTCFRNTRWIGVGWLTMLALFAFTLVVLCGGLR